jgi:hypothetical protein
MITITDERERVMRVMRLAVKNWRWSSVNQTIILVTAKLLNKGVRNNFTK